MRWGAAFDMASVASTKKQLLPLVAAVATIAICMRCRLRLDVDLLSEACVYFSGRTTDDCVQ